MASTERYLNPRQSQANRDRRTRVATADFLAAARLADEHGWTLACHSYVHFALRHKAKGWLINIYPSNQRLYHDAQHRGPFLRVCDGGQEEWTLMDVVYAAIDAAESERIA